MMDFVRKIRVIEYTKTRKDKKGFQIYYLIQVRIFIFWITIRRVLGCNRDEALELVKKLNTYF